MSAGTKTAKVSVWRQPAQVWAVAFACVIAFMGIGLVDPILPAIAESLQATPVETEMLFTSYLVVTGVAMLFTSWISSRIGTKATLLIGLGLIVVFALLQNVARYAIQAPNDINRYYAGVQLWEVGFGVAPERIPGIRVLDSEMGGIPVNPLVASLEGPASLALQAPWSVENHINLMSDDESVNGAALHHVQSLLETGGGR